MSRSRVAMAVVIGLLLAVLGAGPAAAGSAHDWWEVGSTPDGVTW